MGVYTEYLDMSMSFPDLSKERKTQLKRISELRGGNDVLVMAVDLSKERAPISIIHEDIVPLTDQLSNMKGDSLDFILETPGGYGEVAEHIIRFLRKKYQMMSTIIPGYAQSAGTIMAMASDEILMGDASALGPIDAQMMWQGKVFSADALIMGLDKMKAEVEETGVLPKIYIPILQGISPGEIQAAHNQQEFARRIVTDWLAEYKFRDWETHSSTGSPVTKADKEKRAREIASGLSKQSKWFTHGRAITIQDLHDMRLRITNFDEQAELSDAIRRYYALLRITFSTNVYKIFETPDSQIYRFIVPQTPSPQQMPPGGGVAELKIKCNNCQNDLTIQANIGKPAPLKPDNIPFPENNIIMCPHCDAEINLTDARRQLEMQTKTPVVFDVVEGDIDGRAE